LGLLWGWRLKKLIVGKGRACSKSSTIAWKNRGEGKKKKVPTKLFRVNLKRPRGKIGSTTVPAQDRSVPIGAKQETPSSGNSEKRKTQDPEKNSKTNCFSKLF